MGKKLVSNSCESASATSSASSTVTDLMEDASSSSCTSLNGPLYELTELMAHLPIKRRGLSKYYQGKSQSFTSLGSVKMLEDLAKKENPFNKRMKLCSRSYGGGFCAPKPTIAKKPSSSSSRGGSFLATVSMVGSIPIHK